MNKPFYTLIAVLLMVIVASSTLVLVSSSTAYEVSEVYAQNSRFKYTGSWSGTLSGTWTEAYPQEQSTWFCEVKLDFTVQDVGSNNSAPLIGKAKVILQQPHYAHIDPNIGATMQISPTEYTVEITGAISIDPPQLTIYPHDEPPITASLTFYPEEGEPDKWVGKWQTGVLWLFENLAYVEMTELESKTLALSTSYQAEEYTVSAEGEITSVLYPTWGIFMVGKTDSGAVTIRRNGEELFLTMGEVLHEKYLMLQEGDTILTAVGARVEIAAPEEKTILLIEDGSEIKIRQIGWGEKNWEFELWGKAWFKIDRRTFHMEFYTPQAAFTVRGTEFAVDVAEDGTTTLIVLGGVVEFSDLNLRKTVEVREYQTSVVKPGEVPSDPVSIDPDKIVKWWEGPTPLPITEATPTPSPTITSTPTPEKEEEITPAPEEAEKVDKGCIIATSTYGSELAPEVQFLRTFREETVYSTFAGTSFMTVFNQFYYSWSPAIASQIWQSEPLQAVGRVLISPLLGILHVSTVVNSVFSFSSELGIVLTGLVASSLIGAVYFMPLTTGVLYAVKRKRQSLPKASKLAVLLVPWSISIVLICLGEAMASTVLLMAATGAFVVFTIALVAGAIALKILER